MKKFLKYFRWILSSSVVFLFVLLNLLNTANASVNGLGAAFSGNGSSWNVTIVNEGDTYSTGATVAANFRAFHCNKAGSDPCADNFGLADYDRLLANQSVTITVPAKGSSGSMSLTNESASCGRVQVDLGSSDGVYGGTVYSLGADCVGSTPPAPASPASQNYGPLNPTASASCSNGMENISANWSGNGNPRIRTRHTTACSNLPRHWQDCDPRCSTAKSRRINRP